MSESTVSVPPMLAIFESGEARGDINFKPEVNGNGACTAHGEDELYTYSLTTLDTGASGTIFIRNKETDEYKAVPVSQFMQISRALKLHHNEEFENAGVNGLVTSFGTRAAKRIQKMRYSAGK